MALVQLQNISVSKKAITDPTTDIILYYLLSDAGPSEPQLISSHSDLRTRYNASEFTQNYRTAEYLLNLGYRLLVIKATDVNNYTSLRIFDDGSYSHPEKGNEYTNIVAATKSSNQTYSLKITFTNEPKRGDYFLVTNVGYITSGYYNEMFLFSTDDNDTDFLTQDVGIGNSSRYEYFLIPLNSSKGTWREILKDKLESLGYIIDIVGDTFYLKSYVPLIYTKLSSFDSSTKEDRFKIVEDTNSNYDYECSSKLGTELLDFYSKDPLNRESIVIKFKKNYLNCYDLEIRDEVDSQNLNIENYIVTFDKTNTSRYIENVLRSSELVEVKVHKTEFDIDLTGTYYLKRTVEWTQPTDEELIKVVSKDQQFEQDAFDYVVDCCFNKEVVYALYNNYKNVECLKLFSIPDEKEINPNYLDSVAYFYPQLLIGERIYPAWVKMFELIKSGEYSGQLSNIQALVKTFDLDDTSDYFYVNFDNYRYLIPSRHIIVNNRVNCIETLIFLSRIRTKVLFNIDLQSGLSTIRSQFTSLLDDVVNTEGSRVDSITVDEVSQIDQVVTIKISLKYDDVWIDPVYLNLQIDS